MSKNSNVKGKTPPQLDRSIQAAKRKALHAQRTPEQQLALIQDRPGASKREVERIIGGG